MTKLVGVTLRLIVLAPGLLGLGAAVDSSYRGGVWFEPISRFWYFPLFGGLFGLLCILPYPSFLFLRVTKPLVLGVVLAVCAFKLRHEFLPFHYAAPELASYPEYVAEFEAAKREPNGFGFSSRRREGDKMLWIVNKANYTTQHVVIMGSFCLVPVALFLLRSYEVRRGITWRNFTSPPQTGPAGSKPAASSIPAV